MADSNSKITLTNYRTWVDIIPIVDRHAACGAADVMKG